MMTDRQIAIRILLTGIVLILGAAPLLSGCAVVFPPEPSITIAAGSSVCTAPTVAECERLSKIAASLHSPEMEAAIAEARK